MKCGTLLIAAAAAALVGTAQGSAGDNNRAFQACVRDCRHDTCSGPEGAAQLMSSPELWLLGWNCGEECNYQCMHSVESERAGRGLKPVQYFGKWPFTRSAGCQELFSTLFSMGNALPHLFFLFFMFPRLPASGMATTLAIYAVGCINTWVWSTAFHCRDNFWTERLDYHCASLLLVMTLLVTIVRVLRIRSRAVAGAVAGGLLLGFAAHVVHMNTVLFDYGWNMTLSIAVVGLNILLWMGWVAVHATSRPYVLHMALLNIALIAAGTLEVYDFAPVWGHLDAHACWHGLTIPIGVYWYYIFWIDAAAEAATGPAKSLYATAAGDKSKREGPSGLPQP